MRVGALLEGGRYSNFDQSNANGTFTFSSMDTYLAGTPATYRIRQGEVNTDFGVYQLGVYWQDDYPREQPPLRQRGRAQRDAEPDFGQVERDAACRLHVDTEGQQDEHARRLRHVLRLVRLEPV